MPASSLIFLVIVVLWAAYLVPSAIRRRRHAAEARVGDRDSGAMRVVVRQGPAALGQAAVVPGSSRPVLAGPAARPQLAASAAAAPTAPVVPPVAPVAREPRVLVQQSRTSRVVRRRRRLLGAVLAAAAVTWVLVLASVAPAWAALVPTAVLALVVVALRRHAAQAPARLVVPTAVVPAPATVAEEEVSVLDDLTAQLERELADEVTRVTAAASAAAATVPAPRPETPAAAAGEGSSWEPTEVPLPTYLLKPRARVVRPAAGAPVTAPAAGPVEVDVEVAAPSVRGHRVIDVRDHARVVNG
ncbi:hypothetical protein [Kineococcus sp. SYSU DK018]|uniref:hypothetical protein n=1 Tax=Kineococcus sp. SYSU DK018 TaxID=3383139 RepID=UPI003D7E9204